MRPVHAANIGCWFKNSWQKLGSVRPGYAVPDSQTIKPKDTAMKTTSNQPLSRNFVPQSQCSTRALKAALMVFTGLAVSTASAQTETTYRWWNPNGSPETGFMNDSPNWEDFIKPSLHPEARNRLVFDFANDGTFEAINNLRDYLSVSSLFRGYSDSEDTACISGLPLRLTSPDGEKVEIENRSRGRLIIETPLFAQSGILISRGAVEFAPSNSIQHSLAGGIRIGGDFARMYVTTPWHLGSPSNPVELTGGALLFEEPITIPNPILCDDGVFYTATGLVTLSQMGSSEKARKTGEGTLRIFATGPESACNWTVSYGVLEAGPGTIDSEKIAVELDGTLRLLADADVEPFSSVEGTLDLNGHTLTTQRSYFPLGSKIIGDGTFRAIEETQSISSDLDDFDGVIEASGSVITINRNRITSSMTLSVPSPTDKIQMAGPTSLTIGSLSGQGTICHRDSSDWFLTIGMNHSSGDFPGTIQDVSFLTKLGTGTQSLTGQVDMVGIKRVEIDSGTLRLSQSAADDAARITIASPGTFSPHGNVNVPMVQGAGTVALNSQTLTIGETDLSFTLSGTLTGNTETSTLRKRGSGTFTLSADTTGFGGFFQINDGTVRFTGGPILPAAASLSISNGALRGYGELSVPFWNQGTIAADSSAGVLRLTGQDQWNNGTILAENGGALELDGVFLEQDFSGGLQHGRLESNETPIRMVGDNPTIVQGGTIETTGTGSLELIGSAITLRGVDHSGHLSLRSGVDVTAEDFDIVAGAEHTIEVEFEPDTDEFDGAIRGHGTATLGGTLQVTLPDGYEPATGDSMTIIDGEGSGVWTIDESFESIDLPDISPLLMRVVSNPDSLSVVVSCDADLAAPFGALNFLDVSAFLDLYGNGDLSVDLAAPYGTLNFLDVSAYLAAFGNGCP